MQRIILFAFLVLYSGMITASISGEDEAIYLDERMRETKKKHATYYC